MKNYGPSYEIIGITDDEVIVQAVEQYICPICGHVAYSHGPIRHIPRKNYENMRKRIAETLKSLF